MKKYITYTVTILMGLSLLTACSDMLEETNYGSPTPDEMFKSETNVKLVVGQAYAELKWLHDHWGYWGVNTLSTDECVCPIRKPGDHWADGGYWANLNNHKWLATGAAFQNIWESSIGGAVLCNKLLQQLKDNEKVMDPKVYSKYIAELEVLRSYYFYTLFDSFGRIPYTEKFEKIEGDLLEPYKVWSNLVKSLERNVDNLPTVNSGNRNSLYGRATQGLGYALLARLYLNAESYGCTPQNVTSEQIAGITQSNDFFLRAKECCDKIIDSGSYQIEPDFFTNFLIDNQRSTENIFVIVENGNADFDPQSKGSMSNKLRVSFLSLHYCHQQAWDLIEKPWNGFCAPPDFMARYESKDYRGAGNEGKGTENSQKWGWFIGPIKDKKGNLLQDENKLDAIITTEIDLPAGSNWEAKWNQGARFLKYEVDKNKQNKFCENDFVLFRYADVLYMKAEAEIRLTGATTLINNPSFQAIRTRANVDPYTQLTLDEILNERGREFAWEMVRRRDLIRFDKYSQGKWMGKDPMPNRTTDWFPIPQKMLETSPNWRQNTGY